MMNKKKSDHFQENIIYLIFWIIVFTFPILLSPGREGVDWNRVVKEFMRIIPFFIVFIVNNFSLFSIFREKKYFRYLVLVSAVILGVSFISAISPGLAEGLKMPPPGQQPARYDTLWMLNTLFYNCIFSILVIGLNNAIRITFQWMLDRNSFEQLQKENLKNQLSVLQHQISPHFFMNTLNNIHALIEYDQEKARTAVVKLSKLMRVLLYENENYTLQKEIEFIKDYIELMKIRVNEKTELIFEYPVNVPKIALPPLLFISFVENSFKHGVRAIEKSFIHVSFSVADEYLTVIIKNSKNNSNQPAKPDAIGLSNSRQRLDLIYGNNYSCDIRETETTFEVCVKIPLDENQVHRH